VTQADPKTIIKHFGGEGEGAHTHMVWDWQVGETFKFFVQKQPGAEPGTTDGTWRKLHDAYFRAEGRQLDDLFGKLKPQYGEPVFGEKGKKLAPISDKALSPELIKELKSLPQAAKVQDR
jgi:hypothetical protein